MPARPPGGPNSGTGRGSKILDHHIIIPRSPSTPTQVGTAEFRPPTAQINESFNIFPSWKIVVETLIHSIMLGNSGRVTSHAGKFLMWEDPDNISQVPCGQLSLLKYLRGQVGRILTDERESQHRQQCLSSFLPLSSSKSRG